MTTEPIRPDVVPSPAEGDLDLRGFTCPLPVLKTRRALARAGFPCLLVIWTSDPLSGLDIPHFCASEGHQLRARDRFEAADGPVFRFAIEKGAPQDGKA